MTASGSPAAALSWPAIREYYPQRKPGRFIRAVPEHNLVYVKNPKAASSTLMVWLDRLHTGDTSFELKRMHQDHRLPSIGEVGRGRLLRMLSGEAYRFSFVRHPVRRLESVYWAKMVNSRRYRLKAADGLGLPVDAERVVTFEEFVGAVEQQDPVREMDPHWRPQHINLLHPLIELDLVGRLETFEADLERLRKEARLPHVPLVSRNVSPRKNADSVYDGRPDLRRRVEQIYAKDMELYGY
ncbi:MAG TPA: sulfotransferase family protein [Nocardioides sp.]|nr:sulfotransferase family protein [Nocardioides sp.]